jgi:SARP family transcriptional regulator, regulator of embCAB operon
VTVHVRVLGPLELTVDGEVRTPGGHRERAVLARLALARGRPVSADALVEAVWPGTSPDRGRRTLQVHVSNLRTRLRPHDALLRHDAAGYRLAGDGLVLDLAELDRHLEAAQRARADGDTDAAAAALATATATLRGPLADDLDDAVASTDRARYDELAAALEEQRLEVDVERGRPTAVAELEAAVRAAPLRERRWALLMLALYRAGRQADALAAYRRAREVLAEEAGVDPSVPLRRLEAAVLEQADAEALLHLVSERPAAVTGPCLLWLDAVGTPRRRELPAAGELVIGRTEAADVRLDGDAMVSRRHARVRRTGDGWELDDLGSTNGTTHNGTRLESPVPLGPGDLVRCGDTRLLVSGARRPGPLVDVRATVRRLSGA